MMQYDPTSLRRPLAELERWTSEMVLWFKPQTFPLPVITIQQGHRNVLGWYAWSRWESCDGAILNEINFVPEYLGRDVFDIAETLLHELVHLANYNAGIRDCSSNQYHNAKFRDQAVAVGLECERFRPYGWARTRFTPALRQRVAAITLDPNAFDLFRLPPAPAGSSAGAGIIVVDESDVGPKPKSPKLSKWRCLGACASAWVASGTQLHAVCQDCGSMFVRADSLDSKRRDKY